MKTANNFASPSLFAGVITAGLLLSTAFAADWPSWGGSDPGRNMYSPATGLPDHFDAGKHKPNSEEIDMATTKNVKWVEKLGSGQAFGNVVVSGGGCMSAPTMDLRVIRNIKAIAAFCSVLMKNPANFFGNWSSPSWPRER